jgi:hypothetical protein
MTKQESTSGRGYLSSVVQFLGSFAGWLKAAGVVAVIATLFVTGDRAGWYGTSNLMSEPLSATSAAKGIVYFLPKTEVIFDVSYRITRCDAQKRAQSDTSPIDIVIGADVQIDNIAAKVQPDLASGYVIPVDSLDGVFWRTELSAQLANGILTGLNTTSAAQTADASKFQSILMKVVSAAPLTDKTSAGAGQDLAKQRISMCGDRLIRALEGPDPKSDVDAKIKKILRFDPSGGCPPEATALSKGQCLISGQTALSPLLANSDAAADALNRYSIEIRVNPNKSTSPPAPTTKGIAYRTPGSATIQLCMPKCDGGQTLANENVVVPQFGSLASLTVERRLFSDRTTQAKFGPWGELVDVKFTDSAASPVATGNR